MKIKTGVWLLVGILLALKAEAQSPTIHQFALKDAIDYAKKYNYVLKNSKLDLLASQKKVNEIVAMGLPQVNASANVINNTQIPVQVIPNFLKEALGSGPDLISVAFGRNFTSGVSVTANQLLFDGTFFLGVKASKEFVNLSQLNVNRTEIETEVNISKAYFLVLLLESNEKMMRANLASLQKTASDVAQFYKNGFSEKVDLDRLTLQLSNLSLQNEKIQDQKRIAMMVLKLQLGLPMSDSLVLTDELEALFSKPQSLAIEDKVDFGNRVEYKMLQQQLRLNQMDKRRYLVGYMPSIFLFASHQQNAFGDDFSGLFETFYPGTAVGLSVSLPLFDGFRKHAQAQQASISITKTENDIKNFENVINQQVYQAKSSYIRSKQQLDIQRDNLKLAEDIYSKMELKYKNGVGSSLELTSSQADLENARTNMLSTVYEFFVAELELKKALGIINNK
ncbi:MAG: TolC family protein [Sphingobacteriales bacterium]|nr:TolC family protein [Sphingobacteriales bacterium]